MATGRDTANNILMSIGQSTITDSEAIFLPSDDADMSLLLSAIARILNMRGAQGGAIERLNAYAAAHNIPLSAKKDIVSNIFIGSPLE